MTMSGALLPLALSLAILAQIHAIPLRLDQGDEELVFFTTSEPSIPESTIPDSNPSTESTTSEPTTPEPTTSEPTIPEPTTPEPTTPEPTTPEPTITTPSGPSVDALVSSELIFRIADANNDGQLSFPECVDAVEKSANFSKDQKVRFEHSIAPREVFQDIDSDDDGQLTMEELEASWEKIKKYMPKIFAKIFADVADENGDGAVDYDEFVDFIADIKGLGYQTRNELAKNADLQASFAEEDTNEDGKLDMDEIKAAIRAKYESIMTTTTMMTTTTTVTTTAESTTTTEAPTTPALGRNERDFNKIDKNGDGHLDYMEYANGIANYYLHLSESQTSQVFNSPILRAIFSQLDTDEDGQLSLEEFLSRMDSVYFELVNLVFGLFDENGDHHVDYDEWVDFFATKLDMSYRKRNELAENPAMQELFKSFDSDGDNALDLGEYAEYSARIFEKVVECEDDPTLCSPSPSTHGIATESTTMATDGTTPGIVPQEETSSPGTTTVPAETIAPEQETVPEEIITTTIDQMTMAAASSDDGMLEYVFKKFDANDDGALDFEEFFDGLTAAMSAEQKEMIRQRKVIRKIFDIKDANGDGRLSLEEFLAKNDKQIFDMVDANGDGLVDFDEFFNFGAEFFGLSEEEKARVKEALREKFEEADKNGDGKLDLEEFKGANKISIAMR